MSTIPIDLERKFEQRWVARFSSSITRATRRKHLPERRRGSPTAAIGKKEDHRDESRATQAVDAGP